MLYILIGILHSLSKYKLMFIEVRDISETARALNDYKRACDCGRGAVSSFPFFIRAHNSCSCALMLC
jgi:hypothetical protein